MEEDNENDKDFYNEYDNYVDDNKFGKNETNEDKHYNGPFGMINELEKKPQTELGKKPNHKNKINRKNSLAEKPSNVLKKKKNRPDEPTKKKKKTKIDKDEMEISVKNKTEIEYDKKEIEKKLYEDYNNNEIPYYDFYDQPQESGDFANLMNSDEAFAGLEVNQTRQIYTTTNNFDVQETFNMILSSNK